jgi:hypothetical protein
MPKSLPPGWLEGTLHTLNVVRDLGGKGNIPHTSLSVVRVKPSAKSRKTQNLKWRFLPEKSDDPRPFAGRTNRGNGKRLYIEGTCGTPDPWEAAKVAISASQEKWKALHKEVEEQQVEKDHALSVYWERWYARAEQEPRPNKERWLRDKRLLWSGGTGIGLQPWATTKSIERIHHHDFLEFFRVITLHCNDKGTSGDESKRQYKTLIRHLFKEARSDFPALACPEFPQLKKQIKQKRHFTHQEWEQLVSVITELSGGAARLSLTQDAYLDLGWTPTNRQNQRNWVDLYDALHLQWFYYLRSQDAPRLRSEWFSERQTEEGSQIVCFLEKVKSDRDKHETYAYRPDALENIRRVLKRKPKGWLVFPYIKRKEGSESESNVGETINFLLKKACEKAGISTKGIDWTTCRHTAFRLTLEEFPELGTFQYIRDFAENGHTSSKMLEETYLRFIQREATATKARAAIKPGKWSLVKRISLD